MSEKDFDTMDQEKKEEKEDTKKGTDSSKEEEYEEYCFLCRRSESQCKNKLIHLPNHINICPECMQKTFDGFNNSPNVQFIDMNNFDMSQLNMLNSMPKSQRVKKKKEDTKAKKEFNLKDVPPPHEIKAKLDDYVIGQEYAKKVISVAV